MKKTQTLLKKVCAAIEDKKGENILVLDISKISSFTDYFVICHGRSPTHVRSVADDIEEAMQQRQLTRHHREGRAQSTWIVLDYIDVVVHVFTEETRNFYAIEHLWGDAPRIQPALGVAGDSE